MQLDRPFIRLPIRFDAEQLAQEVKALPVQAWRAHPQGYAGNSALPLIAAHGNPLLDRTKGPMRPTPWLASAPYLREVMASLQSPVGRSRLMRIQGNGEAHAHVDTNYYWMTRYRVHIPIITDPGVQFIVGKRAVNMAAGECWVFDTWSTHNVINTMPTERIHLVIDTIGGPLFKQWVDAGECPDVFNPPPNSDARLIVLGQCQLPLRLEHDNQPLVMHPFELRHWLNTSLAQLADPSQRALLLPLLVRLDRSWTAWFAEHGALESGHAGFRQRLQEFDAALAALPQAVALKNGSDAIEFLRQMIVRVALNPELAWPEADIAAFAARDEAQKPRIEVPVAPSGVEAPIPAPVPAAPAPVAPAPAAPIAKPQAIGRPIAAATSQPYFDRPVFVVCPPRSGSSMLFEALCQSPEVLSIGGESHQIMEQIPALNPARIQFDSNRVDADAATAVTVAELSHGFFSHLRDRDGRPVRVDARRVRFVEKTPKNALRVAFLAAAFPDAHFVVLHRDPRDTISSMLDAWRSRRFVTYPRLPGWTGQPWSLLLTPGWREWNEKPLNEVAARQWAQTVRVLLDDLAMIPRERVHVIRYQELLDAPEASLRRLCAELDLAWDRPVAELPPSKHTLTPHAKEKWRQNEDALREALPIAEPMVRRFADFVDELESARGLVGIPPSEARHTWSDANAKPIATTAPAALYGQAGQLGSASTAAPAVAPKVAAEQAFGSVYTRGMAELLAGIRSSVVVTTYQSGRLILLRAEGQGINTHFKSFPSPMGVAAQGDRLAIATARGVWEYHNQRGLAQAMSSPVQHDACFVPRSQFLTGDIRVHEIGYTDQGLCIVNTRFSCLSTLDGVHSFVPRWQPKFITKLEATDRCHLNGLTVIDGKLRFVSCLAMTDTPGAWREHKADGGVIIDVASHECVATGLSMPHSPRWYQDRLWVLESGLGTLSQVDLATGRAHPFVELPGFVRGLAFVGPYALIGLSQIREGVFGGLPVMDRIKERVSGVWAVDLRTARIAGFLRFEGQVQEIFDVALLPGLLYPELFEPEDERLQSSFVVPNGVAS